MITNRKFWAVTARLECGLANLIASAFEDDALAVTVMSPPRSELAQVEWLFGQRPDIKRLKAQLSIIGMIRGFTPPGLSIKELPKLDWLKKVAEDFPPLCIGRWTIHGAQHREAVPDRRHALQIDATNAFGTGAHPTTRGCLLILNQILKQRHDLHHALDVGCGSGILAMGFTKASHGKAVAVDLDPVSVSIARNNRNINGLRAHISIGPGRGYTAHRVKKNMPYDLIMSNIFATPLAHMAKDLKRNLRPDGIVILAGLLNSQANRVLSAHRLQGLYLLKRMIIGEWSILVLGPSKRA